MEAVAAFAGSGGPVVGVCNGFQVLTEAGLLPGALQKNGRLRFLCEPARLVVASTASVLTSGAAVGDELVIPINHFSGNFTCDDEALRRLRDEDRIVLRYADNPNGSVDAIAGIANEAGNVVGLMPHPERASSPLLGSEDGLVLLRALAGAAGARTAA
jgi:phosphoribosylformylglycinamidine synthase